MQAIPLEDNFNDILAKAMRGRKLSREQLAQQAGLDVAAVKALLGGEFDEPTARKLAPLLGLGEERLVASGRQAYRPEVAAPEGLMAFNTPYDDYHVNAFLVWDPETKQAVAFDTGSDSGAITQAAAERGLTLGLVLLTHTHPDHIMDLSKLTASSGAKAYVSELEPTAGAETFAPGHRFEVGRLNVETRKTTGHSRGGTTYVVTGLGVPLAVVGDALFAGSMGGGIVSYDDALANNRSQILTLPNHTVICPGHGPLTTVGLEKRHNPFYPELN